MKSHCFTVDHHAAGRAAALTILDHGHRRIAVVAGPAGAGDNRQRLQGFFDVLAEAGIDSGSVIVEEGEFHASSGWSAAERLLARRRGKALPMTALFCANDQMAMGAISCLQHRGVAVPTECSVMGYDDSEVAAFLSPRLTTIQIPIAEMGLNACRQLLNACAGMTLPVSRKFVPRLVLRDSLARV